MIFKTLFKGSDWLLRFHFAFYSIFSVNLLLSQKLYHFTSLFPFSFSSFKILRILTLTHVPSFVEIAPPVPVKILKRVFTIYGSGGHLDHVTRMPRTNFRSPFPRRLHIKFGFNRPSGFWEDV